MDRLVFQLDDQIRRGRTIEWGSHQEHGSDVSLTEKQDTCNSIEVSQ